MSYEDGPPWPPMELVGSDYSGPLSMQEFGRDVQMDRITLRRLDFGAYTRISNRMLRDMKMEVGHTNDDFIRDMLTARMKSSLWLRLASQVTVEYPKDWWQAFKERWAPEWAKKRWPVQYHKQVWQPAQMIATEMSVPPGMDHIDLMVRRYPS